MYCTALTLRPCTVTAPHCTVLYPSVLRCTLPYWFVLCSTPLYSASAPLSILHCTYFAATCPLAIGAECTWVAWLVSDLAHNSLPPQDASTIATYTIVRYTKKFATILKIASLLARQWLSTVGYPVFSPVISLFTSVPPGTLFGWVHMYLLGHY